MAFVDGVIDNDEKVPSSKNIPSSRQSFKNHTLFKTKTAKIDTLFMIKTAKTVGAAHTYIAHIREYSPRGARGEHNRLGSLNGTEMKEARQPVGNIHLLP